MKIPSSFQVKTTSSRATVRTGLWRHPDAPQCLEASALKTSGRQSNTVWTLGQASPISTQSWILVDTFWKVSTRHQYDVATRPDTFQHFRIFQTSFSSEEMSYSEDRPDVWPSRPDRDLLWKELRYFGRRSQKTIRTRLTFVWTLDSQSSNLSRFKFSISL
jgi:hypothetical protein